MQFIGLLVITFNYNAHFIRVIEREREREHSVNSDFFVIHAGYERSGHYR